MSDPVPITEDTATNERSECCEQTVYARALGCASVEMDAGGQADKQRSSLSGMVNGELRASRRPE